MSHFTRGIAPRTPVSGLNKGAGGLAVILCLVIAACGSGVSPGTGSSPSSPARGSNPLAGSAAAGTVVVGSANFPEDELLAEIYLQALQAKGIKVTPKLNIGAREIYYPQIQQGAITIIPEYNGDLLTVSVDPSSAAATTAQVDAVLKAKLPSTLEILSPAPAQDKDSVTLPGQPPRNITWPRSGTSSLTPRTWFSAARRSSGPARTGWPG